MVQERNKGEENLVRECEELLKDCNILQVGENISKVIGPNGKYIYMRNIWHRISYAEGNKINAFHPVLNQISKIYDKSNYNNIMVFDK